MQERPIDIVVDGFIHLQRFHLREVARGLAGCGTYQLRAGYPACDTVPHLSSLTVEPEDIVAVLKQPSSEVTYSAVNLLAQLYHFGDVFLVIVI